MSDPILKSMRHTPPPAEAAPIEEALNTLAIESARAVAVDLNQMARYGKIPDAPSAVNLQGVRLLDEDWMLVAIVVACPTAQVDGAGNFIKSAYEGTLAEHRRAQWANPPQPPKNRDPD